MCIYVMSEPMHRDGKILKSGWRNTISLKTNYNFVFKFTGIFEWVYILISCLIVSWEPEGHYHYSAMFNWEPEGRYHLTMSVAIMPCWFSTERGYWLIMALMPFWLSTDDL